MVIALIIPFLVFYIFNYRTSLSLPKPSLLWKIGKVTRVTFLSPQERLPYQAVEVAKLALRSGGVYKKEGEQEEESRPILT